MQIQKKREWETDFDKRVAPRLDKMETMIQSSIDVRSKFDCDKDQALDNPSPAQAATLEKNAAKMCQK